MNVRRIYAYLVSAVSFLALFFATNTLLHIALVPNWPGLTMETSLQIAILIIGLPIYLGHWLWQQRLVARDPEERGALERRIYLYGLIAVMVGAIAVAGYDLANTLMELRPLGRVSWQAAWPDLLDSLITLFLAVLAWAYHAILLRADTREEPDAGAAGTVRRLYIYSFSAAGLTMILMALNELLRWLLSQFGDETLATAALPEIPRLLVGLPLWLIYWRWANRLFHSSSAEERGSILRKFYLYFAVFIGVVGAVSVAAALLAGVFRTWLGLDPQGDLRDALALLLTFAMLWFYHSLVLRDDARAAEDTTQQDAMRRLYLYLLAAVGLVAWAVGITGELATLIQVSAEGMNDVSRELFAYFTAAIIAGLPVWFLAWRQAQLETTRPALAGSRARRSTVRRVYLYFFLFVSIMAVLGGAIAVVTQLVRALLMGLDLEWVDLAVPIAISVIQLFIWLYHWNTLRGDHRLEAAEEVRRLEELRLVVLEPRALAPDTGAVHALIERLHRVSPAVQAEPIRVDTLPVLASRLDTPYLAEPWLPELANRLTDAEVIIAPWTLFLPDIGSDEAGNEAMRRVAQAVSASPASKLLLPVPMPNYTWIGMEPVDANQAAQDAVEALKRIAAGEESRPSRRMGCGMIALIIVGVIVLINVVSSALWFVGMGLF